LANGAIAAGQTATVTPRTYPGRTFTGKPPPVITRFSGFSADAVVSDFAQANNNRASRQATNSQSNSAT
jgi:hypothetical protein